MPQNSIPHQQSRFYQGTHHGRQKRLSRSAGHHSRPSLEQQTLSPDPEFHQNTRGPVTTATRGCHEGSCYQGTALVIFVRIDRLHSVQHGNPRDVMSFESCCDAARQSHPIPFDLFRDTTTLLHHGTGPVTANVGQGQRADNEQKEEGARRKGRTEQEAKTRTKRRHAGSPWRRFVGMEQEQKEAHESHQGQDE